MCFYLGNINQSTSKPVHQYSTLITQITQLASELSVTSLLEACFAYSSQPKPVHQLIFSIPSRALRLDKTSCECFSLTIFWTYPAICVQKAALVRLLLFSGAVVLMRGKLVCAPENKLVPSAVRNDLDTLLPYLRPNSCFLFSAKLNVP